MTQVIHAAHDKLHKKSYCHANGLTASVVIVDAAPEWTLFLLFLHFVVVVE